MRVPVSCALTVVLLWYGVFGPMRDDIHRLETRLADQGPVIQQARRATVVLHSLEREVRELETALDGFQGSGEPELAPDGLIAEIQVAAADSGLRITGLKPRADLVHGPNADRAIELAIEGSYHDVGGFLDRLSSSARVMTSPEVSLAVGPAAREAGVDAAGSIAVVAFDLLAPVDHPGYDPGGRRDPFKAMTPQESSAVPETASSGRQGLAAVPLADVVVRGIARDGLRRLAILETPDQRSFVVRPLDRLADVVVHDVVSSGVVFVGPDGRSGQIQVHKPVRPASGARP